MTTKRKAATKMTATFTPADVEAMRELYEMAEKSQKDYYVHACKVGISLRKWKDKLDHGDWMPFLNRCHINDRTARLYMQLSRGKSVTDTVSRTTIREARAALTKSRTVSRQLAAAPLASGKFPALVSPADDDNTEVDEPESPVSYSVTSSIAVDDPLSITLLFERKEHREGFVWKTDQIIERRQLPLNRTVALEWLLDKELAAVTAALASEEREPELAHA